MGTILPCTSFASSFTLQEPGKCKRCSLDVKPACVVLLNVRMSVCVYLAFLSELMYSRTLDVDHVLFKISTLCPWGRGLSYVKLCSEATE